MSFERIKCDVLWPSASSAVVIWFDYYIKSCLTQAILYYVDVHGFNNGEDDINVSPIDLIYKFLVIAAVGSLSKLRHYWQLELPSRLHTISWCGLPQTVGNGVLIKSWISLPLAAKLKQGKTLALRPKGPTWCCYACCDEGRIDRVFLDKWPILFLPYIA